MQNFPDGSDWTVYLGLSIACSIYGGLHCLAWNAPFATDSERFLWRMSGVVVSSTPALALLISTWRPLLMLRDKFLTVETFTIMTNWVGEHVFRNRFLPPQWISKSLCYGLFVVIILLLPFLTYPFFLLYIMSRVYLLVGCFINLAHLPDSAYALPLWSQYVPHIG
jgi:hypothetical protein